MGVQGTRLGVFMENENLKQCFEKAFANDTCLTPRDGFYWGMAKSLGTVTRLLYRLLSLIFGLEFSYWLLFWEKEGILPRYSTSEFRSDMVYCCVATTPSILLIFRYWGAVLVWTIKILVVIDIGEKKGELNFTYRYGHSCKQYYFPLVQMIAWKSEFTSRKRRFNRFDEREMLPLGNLLRSSTVYLER